MSLQQCFRPSFPYFCTQSVYVPFEGLTVKEPLSGFFKWARNQILLHKSVAADQIYANEVLNTS